MSRGTASQGIPGMDDIRDAAAVLRGVVYRTPLLPGDAFAGLVDGRLYLKCENLQKTGSFKARGAYNKIRLLGQRERDRGVVAASAGNHAQGVALAARMMGVRATIVMPEDAPLVKVESTRSLGAEVELHGRTFDQAYARMEAIRKERGATLVHPFDDPAVIAGQGTVGLEIAEDLPQVDTVVVPVGGGGLIAGVAIALKNLRPQVRVVGVQAAAAPALFRSRQVGRLTEAGPQRTLADGLALKQPRESTFRVIQQVVDEMILVEEEEIARAVLLLLERARLLAEGAGAVALAALLSGRLQPGDHTVAVVSGGNIDVNVISRIIERGFISDGRYLRLHTSMPDRPGALQGLLKVIAGHQGNVISVYHDRLESDVPLGEAKVQLLLQTRSHEHIRRILAAVREAGFACEALGPPST